MARSLLLILLLLFVPVEGWAQFVVEPGSSAPGTGSANVTAETVRFEFNDDVSTRTNWNTAFVHAPRDGLTIERANLLLDEHDQTAVVEFEVEHEPNTDFTWLVYAVENVDGEGMTEPYVLRYTTASQIGARRVSGTVSVSEKAYSAFGAGQARQARNAPVLDRAAWQQIARMARQSGLGRPAFETATGSGGKAAKSGSAPDFTSIFLLEQFATAEREWAVHGGTVIGGTSGGYAVEYVRDGTYWPLAVHYADRDRTEIASIGFYDRGGNGTPDPVSVSGSDRVDIDLTLYSFPLTTARDNLAAARAEANKYAPDQDLVRVEAGNGSRPTGTAHTWTYRYYSKARDWETRVTAGPLGTDVALDVTPCESGEVPVCDMQPIPADFEDSEAALEAALADGGQAFIAPYALRNLTTEVDGGNLFWWADHSTPNAFWRVRLLASTSTGVETFERFVDMETGVVLSEDALPVELVDFTAYAVDGDDIVLAWRTASETNHAGFAVEQLVPGGTAFEGIAFVEAAGTANGTRRYTHRVANVQPGTHRFRLRHVDAGGGGAYSSEVAVRVGLAAPLVLEPTYPNPFARRAQFRVGLQQSGPVTVALYDVRGRRIRTLFDGRLPAGRMQILQIDGRGLASGRYFIRCRSAHGVRVQSLVLAR